MLAGQMHANTDARYVLTSLLFILMESETNNNKRTDVEVHGMINVQVPSEIQKCFLLYLHIG